MRENTGDAGDLGAPWNDVRAREGVKRRRRRKIRVMISSSGELDYIKQVRRATQYLKKITPGE